MAGGSGLTTKGPVSKSLARQGVELICPHRKNRKRPKTQDGRPLRRFKRRWKIERSISWLQNFRRLVTGYEHRAPVPRLRTTGLSVHTLRRF
jgi:transposase